MSWTVRIKAPPGLPTVHETTHSFCMCPGNMYMCVLELKEKQLREMDTEECIQSLKDVIAELDKGNEGLFDDKWAKDSDGKWSRGGETKAQWIAYGHQISKSYEEFCGKVIRERCRDSAVRFLLYYIAGYSIEYVW